MAQNVMNTMLAFYGFHVKHGFDWLDVIFVVLSLILVIVALTKNDSSDDKKP
jgi:hypothetical protein